MNGKSVVRAIAKMFAVFALTFFLPLMCHADVFRYVGMGSVTNYVNDQVEGVYDASFSMIIDDTFYCYDMATSTTTCDGIPAGEAVDNNGYHFYDISEFEFNSDLLGVQSGDGIALGWGRTGSFFIDEWYLYSNEYHLNLVGQAFLNQDGTSCLDFNQLPPVINFYTTYYYLLDNRDYSLHYFTMDFNLYRVPTSPVPEPATMFLFGTGLAVLARIKNQKEKATFT